MKPTSSDDELTFDQTYLQQILSAAYVVKEHRERLQGGQPLRCQTQRIWSSLGELQRKAEKSAPNTPPGSVAASDSFDNPLDAFPSDLEDIVNQFSAEASAGALAKSSDVLLPSFVEKLVSQKVSSSDMKSDKEETAPDQEEESALQHQKEYAPLTADPTDSSHDTGWPFRTEKSPPSAAPAREGSPPSAQVYFTTPSETREQAMREISPQLRSESGPGVPVHPTAQVPVVPASRLICAKCDRENLTNYRFCGSCGSQLNRLEAAEVTALPAEERAAETLSALGLTSNQPDNNLRFLREQFLDAQYYEPDPSSHRGRYAIATLAIILVGVIYVARSPLRSHLQSVLQSFPAAQLLMADARPTRPAMPTPTDAQQFASHENPLRALSPPEALPTKPGEIVSRKPNSMGQVTRAGAPLTPVSYTEAAGPAFDGTQELLLAQRYLEGRRMVRDSKQAAALLWKAISKQNARADVLLADLYLLGDGVPKSCDQARLLLVAAAKKSVPAAAEKLHNLESSGCQ